MKARVIKACDFQADAPWTLGAQEKAITAYERRMIRLWRVGFLPHEICSLLNISKLSFVDKIESLSTEGVDLRPDGRTEPDFLKLAGDTSKKQRVSDKRFAQMLEDYRFFTEKGVKRSLVARLLECPQHYLGHLKNKSGVAVEAVTVSKKERDQRICQAFLGRKGERGLKSSLAREFELSNKSIDLILANAGIDSQVRAKRNVPQRPETIERDRRICEDYNNKALAVKVGTTSPRGLVSSVAGRHGVTTTYVYKVLKANGVR